MGSLLAVVDPELQVHIVFVGGQPPPDEAAFDIPLEAQRAGFIGGPGFRQLPGIAARFGSGDDVIDEVQCVGVYGLWKAELDRRVHPGSLYGGGVRAFLSGRLRGCRDLDPPAGHVGLARLDLQPLRCAIAGNEERGYEPAIRSHIDLNAVEGPLRA